MAKIEVARADNGDKVWVPEHWMTDPILKLQFKELPSTRARVRAAETSESAASAEPTSTPTTATRGSNKPKE